MPFQSNQFKQSNQLRQVRTRTSLRDSQRAPSSRWRIYLILLLVVLLPLVVACAPERQSRAPVNALPKTSSQPAFTYVAIGASDSFGVGTDDPARDSWPRVLAGLMGPDTHLINLGIPGETAAQARATELPIALDAKPNVVTIWLGVNDIIQSVPVETYAANVAAILRALDTYTNAHVFVANIPDLTTLPYFAGYDQHALQAKIARWNSALEQAVGDTHAMLVDLNASWAEITQHPEYIASDGLHPSTEGARQLAAAFLSWIIIVMPDIHTEAGAT